MTRWRGITCLAAAAMLLIAGCDQEVIKVSDQDIHLIAYTELLVKLNSGKPGQTVIVDVRKAADFDQGHIPGAINIFLPKIAAGDARLANAREIIVYASGWIDPLSQAGAKRLIAVGYSNVDDFRGGIEAWQKEGRRLEATPGTATQP